MYRRKSKRYANYDSLAIKEQKNVDDYSLEIDITSLKHRKSLLEENKVVCIYLWGSFCHPCTLLAPKYVELSKQYYDPGKCILMKENVESEYTRDYQITGVPAFIFYKNGDIVRNDDGKIIDVLGGDFEKVKSILNKLLN